MDSAATDYDAARYRRAGRGKIFDSIVDTIGDTPCPAQGDTLSLTPARNHTDGFFVAVMERKQVA